MKGWQGVKPLHSWMVYLTPFLVIALLILYDYLFPNSELNPKVFLTIYVPLEVLRIANCIDIIFVRIITRHFTSELQNLLIAVPFLIAAIFFTFRLVENVVLSASVYIEHANQVLYFRNLGRWSIIILLLIASFIPANKRVSVKWSYITIASFFIIAVFIAILVLFENEELRSCAVVWY